MIWSRICRLLILLLHCDSFCLSFSTCQTQSGSGRGPRNECRGAFKPVRGASVEVHRIVRRLLSSYQLGRGSSTAPAPVVRGHGREFGVGPALLSLILWLEWNSLELHLDHLTRVPQPTEKNAANQNRSRGAHSSVRLFLSFVLVAYSSPSRFESLDAAGYQPRRRESPAYPSCSVSSSFLRTTTLADAQSWHAPGCYHADSSSHADVLS